MLTILYAHGFASSGHSGTAQMLRQQLYQSGVRVLSPDLPASPLQAMELLQSLVERETIDLIVATSMGAFYAEQLKGIARILVNPSFQMSRLLTFSGVGRRPWRNKRADGEREFKVDKEMIAEFKTLEKAAFQNITAEEKSKVWALFGDKDDHVNHQKDFAKHYGTAQSKIFDGGHYLNDQILNREVIPLVRQILQL